MTQPQGSSASTTGRLGAEIGTLIAAGNIALGVGWGSTATVAIAAGSNDQRGTITVTANGAGLAQATSDVTITFADGSYIGAAVPPAALVVLNSSSNAVNEAQPTAQLVSATQLKWRNATLPVAAATYKFSYAVIP